jgi:hypothetical protein
MSATDVFQKQQILKYIDTTDLGSALRRRTAQTRL